MTMYLFLDVSRTWLRFTAGVTVVCVNVRHKLLTIFEVFLSVDYLCSFVLDESYPVRRKCGCHERVLRNTDLQCFYRVV